MSHEGGPRRGSLMTQSSPPSCNEHPQSSNQCTRCCNNNLQGHNSCSFMFLGIEIGPTKEHPKEDTSTKAKELSHQGPIEDLDNATVDGYATTTDHISVGGGTPCKPELGRGQDVPGGQR